MYLQYVYRGTFRLSFVERFVLFWSVFSDIPLYDIVHILANWCSGRFGGIGGYILSYGLCNCMDCIGHERIRFLRSL